MKIDLVLLAAGNSRRFHGNKLLHPYKGKPLILHIFDQIDPSLFHRVLVVSQYPAICDLAKRYGFSFTINPHPECGLSSSLQQGMNALPDSEAILFLVADMPHFKTDTLRRMVNAANEEQIISAYDGEIKNPMLFPKKYFAQLHALRADCGAKKVALENREMIVPIKVDPFELIDIDTQDDIKK